MRLPVARGSGFLAESPARGRSVTLAPMRSTPVRPRLRGRAAAACAALWLASTASGCGGVGDAAEPAEKPVLVEVMSIDPAPFVDTAVFSGQLDAEHSVAIQPEIEGIVES